MIAKGYDDEREYLELNKTVNKSKIQEIQKKMIRIFGEVELDPNEIKFLELDPNFAMMEDLDMDKTKTKFLIALTRITWGRMGKDLLEIERFRKIEYIEEEKEIEIISYRDKREVDVEKKLVTLGYKICTSMKGNRRIISPGGQMGREDLDGIGEDESGSLPFY